MTSDTRHVLIAGGGVAGVETALALHSLAGDRVRIQMLAADPYFTYRPLAVGAPFGGAGTVRVELAAIAAERGFELRHGKLAAVDGAERAAVTVEGDRLPYDDLVLALGARPAAGIPGALTFRGPADVERVRSALEELERQGGGRVIFTSRAVTSWTLPVYELALLTERWAREREVPLEVWIVTPEPSPLGVFGPEVSADVATLLSERGIVLRTGSVPEAADGGALTIPIEGRVPADLIVAMPVLVGSEIAGIPHDDMRFVPVDEFCRVAGLSGVYAVGDMTSHPIKQGGLATQQADVAAACIAAAAGTAVTPEPYRPVLRGLLFTGETPRFLQSLDASDMPSPLNGESTLAPWWPADKIVATHLGNYLATHADLLETPAG